MPNARPVSPQPQGSVIPQANASPTAQPQFTELRSQWVDFFKRPEVVSGLLQFGSTMLTPGSSVGLALGEAAQAAGKTRQVITGRETELQERGLRERGVQAEERRTGVAERGAATQEEQNRIARERLAQEGELGRRGLDIEAQRAAAYAQYIGGGGRGSSLTAQDRIAKTAFDAAFETASMMPEFEDDPEGALDWAVDYVSRKFGGQTTPPPGGEPPPDGAPAPGGAEAAPEEGETTTYTDESGVSRKVPAPQTLTTQDWNAVANDPQLLEGARRAYGEDVVNTYLKKHGITKKKAIKEHMEKLGG